jgi:tetratricopeptide (TPR) repeat protein
MGNVQAIGIVLCQQCPDVKQCPECHEVWDTAANIEGLPFDEPTCNNPLRAHFLSTGYSTGFDMDDFGTGYEVESSSRNVQVYRHMDSGIRVWCEAIRFVANPDEEMEVLFHYTNEATFNKVTTANIITAEVWSSLKLSEGLPPFGPSVYATATEPGQFADIPETDQHSASYVFADYCIPIVLPSKMAVNVSDRATAHHRYGLGKRRSRCSAFPANFDMWVIRCDDVEAALRLTVTNMEQRLRGIMRIHEMELGPDNPCTISATVRLADTLRARDNVEEAEALYKQALSKREATLGARHPETLAIASRLAHLVASQGRAEEAEPLVRRSLQMHEEELGSEDTGTIVCTYNLASILRFQGRLAEAEMLFRHILATRELKHGKSHLDTLSNACDLAELLESLDQLEEAEGLYRRVIDGCSGKLGSDHPDTIGNVSSLARLLQAQGKLDEAEPLYQLAFQGSKDSLGGKHPTTLLRADSLANLLQEKGSIDKAEPLLRNTLAEREALLGDQHPDTLASVQRLGDVLEARGAYADAEALWRRIFEGCEDRLGSASKHTLLSVDNLARLLHAQGKRIEARRLLCQALEQCSMDEQDGEGLASCILKSSHIALSSSISEGTPAEPKARLNEVASRSPSVQEAFVPHLELDEAEEVRCVDDKGSGKELAEDTSITCKEDGTFHPHLVGRSRSFGAFASGSTAGILATTGIEEALRRLPPNTPARAVPRTQSLA